MIAFLVGSGFEHTHQFEKISVTTPHGNAEVYRGKYGQKECLVILRHGEKHTNLPHHINYLANMWALKNLGATAVVSFSVVGALRLEIPLAHILLPTELYFPENRLPDGSICSVFRESGKDRGHLITSSFFHSELQGDIGEIAGIAGSEYTYVHSYGPRFNSKSEIRHFQNIGGSVVSQTCGPEVVLANEMEIPYALVAFPIDYANGVMFPPTSMEELNENLSKSQAKFEEIMQRLVEKNGSYEFEGFIYRF